MEETPFSFDDFSIEMEDFEVRRTKKHDRMWLVEKGGSMVHIPLIKDGIVYFGSLNYIHYAVDTSNGEMVWRFKTEGILQESYPCYWNGKVYFGSFDYNLYCLDAKTGEFRWKYKTFGEINSPPNAADGKIYFGSRDQNLYCVDAETGDLIWKFRTQDEVQSFPAIVDGKVMFGSFDKNFYCVDTKTGRLNWKFRTQGEVYILSHILVKDGIVYFPSFDNNMRAVTIEDGKLLWKFRTGNYGCVCSPVLYKERLYLTSRDGFLIDLTMDGKELWRFTRKDPVSIPDVFQDKIYIGCEDKNLYCLDMQGRVKWKFRTEGAIWLKPVHFDNKILFTCWDCHVYVLDADTGELVWKFRTAGEPSPFPPPYDTFEVVMKRAAETVVETEGPKKYDINMAEDVESTSAYKSRITYQISTQYSEKGKYQIDSQEESF